MKPIFNKFQSVAMNSIGKPFENRYTPQFANWLLDSWNVYQLTFTDFQWFCPMSICRAVDALKLSDHRPHEKLTDLVCQT